MEKLLEILDIEDMETKWNSLIAGMKDGSISPLEVITLGNRLINGEDHKSYIMLKRTFSVMLHQDNQILENLLNDLKGKITHITGDEAHIDKLDKRMRYKDGKRLFTKSQETKEEIFSDSPSLIMKGEFDDCLKQYYSLVNHVENLWDDCVKAFNDSHFPLCTFLAILTIEEIGKLGRLFFDLMDYDQDAGKKKLDFGILGKNHRKKHFISVVDGALINSRLDRIFGERKIKKLLEDTESGKLEEIRQRCLYIDVIDGKTVIPKNIILEETAKFFLVISGELMAENLGSFPWDHDRLIRKVSEYELSIGIKGAELH